MPGVVRRKHAQWFGSRREAYRGQRRNRGGFGTNRTWPLEAIRLHCVRVSLPMTRDLGQWDIQGIWEIRNDKRASLNGHSRDLPQADSGRADDSSLPSSTGCRAEYANTSFRKEAGGRLCAHPPGRPFSRAFTPNERAHSTFPFSTVATSRPGTSARCICLGIRPRDRRPSPGRIQASARQTAAIDTLPAPLFTNTAGRGEGYRNDPVSPHSA